MSRLLSHPTVESAPRALVVPDPAEDPFTKRRVAEAASEAYERGLAEGRSAAVEEARAIADEGARRAGEAVAQAAAQMVAEVRELRAAQAVADIELAAKIAEAVLGREPHDGGKVLLQRCQEALAALDDTPLTLAVNPQDAALLRDELVTGGDVDLVEDTSLAPGEARFRGRWAHAELTREAALNLVREALEAADA